MKINKQYYLLIDNNNKKYLWDNITKIMFINNTFCILTWDWIYGVIEWNGSNWELHTFEYVEQVELIDKVTIKENAYGSEYIQILKDEDNKYKLVTIYYGNHQGDLYEVTDINNLDDYSADEKEKIKNMLKNNNLENLKNGVI